MRSIIYVEAFALCGAVGWLLWGYIWSTQSALPELQVAGQIQLAVGSFLVALWLVTRLGSHLLGMAQLSNLAEFALFALGFYLLAFERMLWAVALMVIAIIGLMASERSEEE